VALAGNRNHAIVIAIDDRRYRLSALERGEVALYDDQDQVVHLRRNGIGLRGLNILLEIEGVLRLHGDRVEIHGETYVQTDVHGKGDRETWISGTNYQVDTYTTGAAVNSDEHGLDQPHIPSEHPEGP